MLFPKRSFALTTSGALFTVLLAGSPEAGAQGSQAPAGTPAPAPGRRNTVRLDLLAAIAANLEHGTGARNAIIFPVLASYERHLGGRWSVVAEALVRGGTPTSRRSGAALLGRWYALPARWAETPLQGFYVSPVLSYRALSTTAGDFDQPVNSGKRGGAGLLLGWQAPPFPHILPNLVIDASAGVVAWTRLGADRTSDPAYYASINEPIFKRTGFLPDARYGLGYRF
jgi:hypothetical protein